MTNKEILKKQIIYRSMHRGTKELDLLLGNFVKRHIDEFNNAELKDLEKLLFMEDQVIYNWYFKKDLNKVFKIVFERLDQNDDDIVKLKKDLPSLSPQRKKIGLKPSSKKSK